MAIACYTCGKEITGEMKTVVPPKFMEVCCGEFAKSYHPKCYEAAEREAARELASVVTAAAPPVPVPTLNERIAAFVAHADAVAVEYYRRNGYVLPPPTHRADYISDGWCRVVTLEMRGAKPEMSSVYAFIRLTDGFTKTLGVLKTGDIHKPAGFKAPAKHARGNVFDADTFKCAGPLGIAYLR